MELELVRVRKGKRRERGIGGESIHERDWCEGGDTIVKTVGERKVK